MTKEEEEDTLSVKTKPLRSDQIELVMSLINPDGRKTGNAMDYIITTEGEVIFY